MRYSRHQEPKSKAVSGIALLTISQLVNLLRSGIPGLAAFQISGERMFILFVPDVISSDILTEEPTTGLDSVALCPNTRPTNQ